MLTKIKEILELVEKADCGDCYIEIDGWPARWREGEPGSLPYYASGIDKSDNNPYRPYKINFDTLKLVAEMLNHVPEMARLLMEAHGIISQLDADKIYEKDKELGLEIEIFRDDMEKEINDE